MLNSQFFKLIYCSFFFLPLLTEAKTYSYFSPPKNWEIATPENTATHVKIGFIGPSKNGFSASLNLATEQVGDLSLPDYIKAVRAIYERSPHNRWRQLGKIRTKAGESSLTEIDTKTEWGDIRLMQMIYLKDKVAYIITAAALKEEFGSLTRDFQRAFQSFNISEDLFTPVGEKREPTLKNSFSTIKEALNHASVEDKKFQKEHWHPFEKMIASEFSDMGLFWQFLLFEEALKP